MQFRKYFTVIWLIIFSISFTGCDWFSKPTRPAPVRPRVPAPTKKTPGAIKLTEKDLIDRIDRIETAAKDENWGICNRETNLLGTDMARYRPTTTNGKSLINIATFNSTYAKLQADVKTKNRPAITRDTDKLRDDLRRIRTSKS